MTRNILYIITLLVFSKAHSQVGIGTTDIHSSAVVELKSTDKGFLPPRLTRIERDNIASPINGLMIYNYDHKMIELYNETLALWTPLSSPVEVINDLTPTTTTPPCTNPNGHYIEINNQKHSSIADVYHNGSNTHTGISNNANIVIQYANRVSHSSYFRGYIKYDITNWVSGDITGRLYYNSAATTQTDYLTLQLMSTTTYSTANNWDETNMSANKARLLGFPLFLNSSVLNTSNDLITSINTTDHYFEFTIPEADILLNNSDSITLRLQQENPNTSTSTPVNPKTTNLYANYPNRTDISFTGTNNGIEGPYQLINTSTGDVLVDDIANTNNGTVNLSNVLLKIYSYDPATYSGSTTFPLRLRSKTYPDIFISNTISIEASPCF